MKSGGPLKRSSPMARSTDLTRTAMRQKRARRTPEETVARQLLAARSMGLCEGCGRAPATDAAHRVGRAQGGRWDVSNLLHLCGPDGCHRWSHENPAAARSVGWMLRRIDDPAITPALLHHVGRVLLSPTGTYLPVEGERSMSAQLYRKTALVEAMQWTGDNIRAIWDWAGADKVYGPTEKNPDWLVIETLEGPLRCPLGDWVLRGPEGECWPVKASIFASTYEQVRVVTERETREFIEGIA